MTAVDVEPALVAQIEAARRVMPSARHAAAVADRAGRVLRPPGAFARLDEVAVWLAGWQRTDRPAVRRPHVLVFAADHGVADRGVSAFPASITGDMVRAIETGVATCSALARAQGSGLTLVDVGVGRPTADLATADALDTERFFEAWAAGTAAVAAVETDLLMLGELGIANTTAASAVAAGLLGGPVADWVGRGTGVDDLGYRNKVEAVTLAAARGPFPPLEALRRAGGAELVAMAAASVEARRRSIPMVLDGFIATAAQMPLELHTPGLLDHALAGHCSAEGGHRRLLERLGKRPLVELDLRLGEATGALMALPLVRLAVSAVLDVGTFDDLGR